MTGRYKRPNGTIFDVIKTKRGLEYDNEGSWLRNRLFTPIKESHLRTMVMFGGATKVNQ